MYDELVALLRKKYDKAPMVMEAADAIEERDRYALTIQHEMMTEAESHIALVERLNKQIEELRKPRWIPVTERLPEERMAVNVYAPYMKNEFMAYWTGSRWMVWAAGESEREMPEYHQITHWMPLPEPPKEEN